MRYLLILIPFVAGCATDPETAKAIARYNAQQALVPTLTLNCDQGCRAEYRDPSKIQQMAMPTNGWDAMKTVVQTVGGVATSVAPYAALGAVGIAGIKNVQAPAANVSTTTTDSHNVSSTVDSNDTTTTTSTDSHDTTTTTTTDSTHVPTVVVQPPPVVIPAP